MTASVVVIVVHVIVVVVHIVIIVVVVVVVVGSHLLKSISGSLETRGTTLRRWTEKVLIVVIRRPTHALVVVVIVVRWTALKVGRVEIGRWLKITTGRPKVAVRWSEIRVAVRWREIRVAIRRRSEIRVAVGRRRSEIRVAVGWRRSEIIPLRRRPEAGRRWAGKIRIQLLLLLNNLRRRSIAKGRRSRRSRYVDDAVTVTGDAGWWREIHRRRCLNICHRCIAGDRRGSVGSSGGSGGVVARNRGNAAHAADDDDRLRRVEMPDAGGGSGGFAGRRDVHRAIVDVPVVRSRIGTNYRKNDRRRGNDGRRGNIRRRMTDSMRMLLLL